MLLTTTSNHALLKLIVSLAWSQASPQPHASIVCRSGHILVFAPGYNPGGNFIRMAECYHTQVLNWHPRHLSEMI